MLASHVLDKEYRTQFSLKVLTKRNYLINSGDLDFGDCEYFIIPVFKRSKQTMERLEILSGL